MGQAKARGTFEERKAQAITAGRIKAPAKRWSAWETKQWLAMRSFITGAYHRR